MKAKQVEQIPAKSFYIYFLNTKKIDRKAAIITYVPLQMRN